MTSKIGTGPQDIPLNQFLGQLAFMDAPPRKVAFQARSNADFNYGANNLVLQCSVDSVNIDGCYSTSTYKFTAPTDGVYIFNASVSIDNNGGSQADDSGGMAFGVNNAAQGIASAGVHDMSILFNPRYYQGGGAAGTEAAYYHSQIIKLTAGDRVDARLMDLTNTSGGTPIIKRALFNGFQII